MRDAQTASSDLESLMYSFLYLATQGQLPWAHLPQTDAMFAKSGCMTQSRLFDREIAVWVKEPSLKATTETLRGLFLVKQPSKPCVSASEFIAALEMA